MHRSHLITFVFVRIKINDLLYLCEPINYQYENLFKPEFTPNYNESDALSYFIKRLIESNIKFDNIIIRPHPSEKREKYTSIKEKFKNINISLSQEPELIHDIIQSKYVFGCQTTAMVVALILGKEVVSCIPPEGLPKNVLPQKEIINLNEWIENQKE